MGTLISILGGILFPIVLIYIGLNIIPVINDRTTRISSNSPYQRRKEIERMVHHGLKVSRYGVWYMPHDNDPPNL